MTGVLLERDGELRRMSRLLQQARDGVGGVVVLTGPLGNGKTALLRALSRHPAADSFSVWYASATLMEQGHSRGVLRQLLEGHHGGPDDDARELHGLVRDLGRTRPVLLLVDDLQWADHRSAVALEALARRVRHLGAVLVVTVREGDPLADDPVVASILTAAALRLCPEPLSPSGAAKLLRARLGRACDQSFTLACHAATGGNPLLLTALALAWAVDGRPPVAANADLVRALRPSLARERIVACLRAQPEPVRRLLTAAAVLGESAEPDVVSALAGLDEPSRAQAVRGLGRLGLFSGNDFAHPVAREAVHDLTTAAERDELHLRAVRLLHDLGKPAESVAGQLLAISVPQGAWAVEALRDAAHVALRRGAPETAVAYLRRALLDTSADGEDRATVLVDLANAERLLDVRAAVRTVSYAVGLFPGPRQRAAALIRLTPAVMGDAPETIVSVLREVVEEFGPAERLDGVDRDLALRLEARLRFVRRTEISQLTRACARLDELPAERNESAAARELLSVLVNAATLAAVRVPARRVAELAERLLAREPASSAHSAGTAPLLVTALAAADSAGAVGDWLDRALGTARQRGDVVEQAMIRTEQALVHLVNGRVAEAATAAAGAFGLGAWNWGAVGTFTAVVFGAVALQLDDPALVDQVLAAVEAEPADPCLAAVIGLLRAQTEILGGRFEAASVILTDCGARLDRAGWRNPVLFPWRSSLALVQLKLGNTGDAIALAEEERLTAEEWGAPSGIGRALRVLGQVVGGERGRQLTQRAVETLRSSAHRLELVHALRRQAELTDDPAAWRSCLAMADEIGARQIAQQARTALVVGTPVPVGGKLTRSEQKVAMLAASGRSNPEIAELLAVSSRAVEKHLTNTYRKLGLRGRSELASALQSGTVPLDGQ
ncbi:AAA family ATPase [Lentzea sp. NPDC004789]